MTDRIADYISTQHIPWWRSLHIDHSNTALIIIIIIIIIEIEKRLKYFRSHFLFIREQ